MHFIRILPVNKAFLNVILLPKLSDKPLEDSQPNIRTILTSPFGKISLSGYPIIIIHFERESDMKNILLEVIGINSTYIETHTFNIGRWLYIISITN